MKFFLLLFAIMLFACELNIGNDVEKHNDVVTLEESYLFAIGSGVSTPFKRVKSLYHNAIVGYNVNKSSLVSKAGSFTSCAEAIRIAKSKMMIGAINVYAYDCREEYKWRYIKIVSN